MGNARARGSYDERKAQAIAAGRTRNPDVVPIGKVFKPRTFAQQLQSLAAISSLATTARKRRVLTVARKGD